jgi:hypothetical protein
VLKDTTTSPTTYQLYLHLAQDSIPGELRTEGAYVAQGQFIGIADDTGKSTGHHLHFHVHTYPDSYWGTSLDITFEDVNINGGRPRTLSDQDKCKTGIDVCDAFRSSYVSGNVVHGDVTPPTADLFQPSTGMSVSSPTLHVEGWASDTGSGLDRGNLIAYFDDQWQDVGNSFSGLTFSLDWNMCDDEVPDGPLSVAVRAWDNAGNPSSGLPGLTHLIKDYSCEPITPQCIPGNDQISIYSKTDYHGNCQILETGSYPDASSFNLVGDDDVGSIQVGEVVFAQLFGEPDFSGRSFTLSGDDSNLADNPIGSNTISSIRVTPRTDPPLTPNQLISPRSGDVFSSDASLSFSWRDPGGATQFKIFVDGPTEDFNSPWISTAFWHLEGIELSPGDYSWRVRARNCTEPSCRSNWSTPSTFTVTASEPSLLVGATPFSDNLESGDGNWHSTGMWNLIDDEDDSHNKPGVSWYYGHMPENNYEDGTPNAGDLTLRPITVPSSGYVLRFWYLYDTENPDSNWDQRWVQISSNGEPFQNVHQLKNDVSNYWLQATLDLADYVGQTIQIRFHFATLDEQLNSGDGWHIDDVEINQYSFPLCSDSDNLPSGANEINFNQTLSHTICPSGDIDYFKFEGSAGDHIVLDIDTPTNDPIEGLDLYLFLLDSDGSSTLASHDDEILFIKKDPHLGYQLGRTGTYYVRARLWPHPSLGGEEFTYDITLSKDNDKPLGELTNPLSGSFLPDSNQFILNVNVTDTASGISHVDFLYHAGDWMNSSWQLLGSDFDGSDGWNFYIDTTTLTEQEEIAFVVKIYDWAGNWISRGAWNLVLDRTPPTTSLDNLPVDQGSTAILLQWSGSDNLSGLDHFELQVQIGNGPWSDINPDPQGSAESTWYIGQPGTDYGFRLRGVDDAGNQEAFTPSEEVLTVIPPPQILCSSPDQWDAESHDNSPDQAVMINLDDSSRVHNFCNPLTSDRLDDEDWVSFSVQEGVQYLMQSVPLAGMTASILELYGSDGTTLLASAQPDKFGESSQIIWAAEQNDQMFLRVRHLNWKVSGNDVLYRLSVRKFQEIYLPFLNR